MTGDDQSIYLCLISSTGYRLHRQSQSTVHFYSPLYTTTFSLYRCTPTFKFYADWQPAASILHCTSVQCTKGYSNLLQLMTNTNVVFYLYRSNSTYLVSKSYEGSRRRLQRGSVNHLQPRTSLSLCCRVYRGCVM